METKNGIKTFYPKTRTQWRAWLEKNHEKEKSVFLILHNKKSKKPSVTYEEGVEEALCFGWIDSTHYKRDDESSYLYFTKRKPNSVWSKLNRDRVAKLKRQGLITPAGQKMINLAKKNGQWGALMEIEKLVIPPDLKKEFSKNKMAWKYFDAFSPSSKKMILFWIKSAKRPETREKRIKDTVQKATKNIKAFAS